MNDDLGSYNALAIGGDVVGLSNRERQIADELRTLDPQLAGLYEQALRFLPKIAEPGIAYFVAQAGREISRGVVQRLLSEQELSLPIAQIDQDEKNRSTIAHVLQLPMADPRVDIWFQLPRQFSAWMKYRESGPPSEEVKDAFEQLSSLLFGRIGPYFSTQAELDSLLQIERPTAADVRTLQTHLLRPAQRQYFFGQLQNPLWAKPLAEAGVFSNPPDLMPTADPNKFLYRPWPEGIYLARIAPSDAPLVLSAFERIPSGLKNPMVWNAVPDAALQLPADSACTFVGKLKEALESGSTNFFAEKIVKITGTLALAGKQEAFVLANHLMWVPPSNEGHDNRIAVYNTEWMFPRFAHFGLSAFFKDVLPTLERIDPERTLKLLLSKIERIDKFSDPEEYGLGIWRRADESHSTRENIPARLFRAVTDIAVRLAKPDRLSAIRVLEILEQHSGKIFTKVRLKFLANAGKQFPEKIDEIITSDDAIKPPHFLREIPELIRKQFRNASPLGRRIFRYGLERGPDMKQVRGEFLSDEITEPDEPQLIALRSRWIRRRLTWFRGEIPKELEALAKEVGMGEAKPTFEEQELAEVGHYIGGDVSWIGEPPVETEDLSTRTVTEIFELLASWTPAQTEESRAIGTKLEKSLLEYCARFPDQALEIARMIMKQQVAPRFVDSLMTGFRQAVQADKTIDWDEVLQFACWAIQVACEQANNSPERHLNWSEVASSAVSLARAGADGDRASQTACTSMWEIMYTASDCGLLWRDSSEEPFRTFEDVLSAALNSHSGRLVEALISVALWTHRATAPKQEQQDSVDLQTAVQRRLIPILRQILDKRGRSGIAGQAMLGHFIPQIHFLAPNWVITNSEELFSGGAESPLSRPIWAAYITRAQTYKNVFDALRHWYLVAAQIAGTPAGRISKEERDWSITRNLAIKVTIEMIRGSISIGDSDKLLETVFTNVPSPDKYQAYWNVFNWWSESSDAPPASFVERLGALWEWRLSEISKQPDHPDSIAEASGLSWLFKTQYIPAETLIRLGLPTIKLARGDIETYGAWEKMLEISKIKPDETFEALEIIIQHELKSEYAYLPVEDVLPTLRTVLLAGGAETRKRATQLINRLGERGYLQFGELLDGP